MNERKFERTLQEVLEAVAASSSQDRIAGEELSDAGISTFEDAGVLTNNRGLVVRLQNGAEFQVTIVQSQEADGADEPEDD
jgi:hypothetical protein